MERKVTSDIERILDDLVFTPNVQYYKDEIARLEDAIWDWKRLNEWNVIRWHEWHSYSFWVTVLFFFLGAGVGYLLRWWIE